MPNAFLWIVPNTGHRSHQDKNKDHFISVSKEFLLQTSSTTESNNSQAIIELLKRGVQAVNDRDFTTLSELFTENFLRHDLTEAFPNTDEGSGAAINFVQTLIAAFPDVRFNIQDIIANEDRGVIRFTFTGTHQGELFGINCNRENY
jgi:hypothetical protein